ncbi:MAG: hypothetical protein PW788_11590 [Micavibrio sp.]|nr:hypothetical protein [Micavibrio sp.]
MPRKTTLRKVFPFIACPAVLCAIGVTAYTVNQSVTQGVFILYPYGLLALAFTAIFALNHVIYSDKAEKHARPVIIETLTAEF